MRQYQPIWDHIKVNKKAILVAPSTSHPKIIQAVMKERSLDLSFRNLLKKNYIKMELLKKSDIEKGTLEFKLVEIKSIKIEDL